MKTERKSISVLMADDDEDDRRMLAKAWKVARMANEIYFVEDGEQLMEYLYHRGRFSDPATSPRPGLILLDLNMPKKDGREALVEIKASPELRVIPVIVLTTSKAEEDIYRTYDLGGTSFITKPVTLTAMVEVLRGLHLYWIDIVALPNDKPGV